MDDIRLGEAESRFADIIWQNEPLASGELVRLSGETLGWKKSTTYTMLKRLCERGIFINDGGVVTSLIPRDEFFCIRGEKLVDGAFGGSLPAFIAAFTKRRTLSQNEIDEIRKMIDGEGEKPRG